MMKRRVIGALGVVLCMLAPRLGIALTISEIMYHSDEVDDTPYEYIELYNENPDPFDLSGYSFCNGVDFMFPEGTWIEGRATLVVCADEAAIQTKYGITNTVGSWNPGGNGTVLSNGGEKIEICNTANITVLEMTYDDRGKWPGGADGTGHSIEIESPFKGIDDADHWNLSDTLGGTPGVPNPCWDEDNQVSGPGGPVGDLDLFEDVGFPCTPGGTAYDGANDEYTISGSGNDIWTGGDQFQFAYVKVSGDFTIQARITSRTWSTSRWGKAGLMARQDLTDRSRYVFVHDNPTEDAARMAFRPTQGGNDNTEPYLATGNPDWYRLERVGNDITGSWSNNGVTWTTFGTHVWGGGSEVLLGLALTSHSNCGVATITWDQLQITGNIIPPPDPPGPGPDPVCDPRVPVVLNEGLFRTAGPRWIEFWNSGVTPIDLTGYHVTDERLALDKATLPPTVVPPGGYVTFTDTELSLDFSVQLDGDRVFVALVEPGATRVIDAHVFEPKWDELSESRVPDGDADFTAAADPTPAATNQVTVPDDLVINEVMYNPIDGDVGLEYIELYHRGAALLDISGWEISRGVNYVFPPGTIIAPGAYIVVARDPQRIQAIYGLSASIMYGPDQTPDALDDFGRLSNRGERIRLKDDFGRTVDTLNYDDGGEWPRWADGHGSSIELIDPLQENRRGSAWDASDDSGKATTQSFSYLGTHGGEESELHLLLLSRGISVVDNVEVIGGAVVTQDTDIIGLSEVWNYFKGTQEPPANWRDLTFDDSSWDSGATGIGYGDGDDVTVLSDMQNSYLTVFCRREFQVADPNAIDELVLSITIDDGFYAYLNGALVASHNVNGTAYNQGAASAGEPTLVEVDISDFKNLLVTGDNVLAVAVHNGNLGSSDLSFIPRLVSRVTTISAGTNQLINGTFDSDANLWMIEGNHFRSGRTTDDPITGGGSLKVVASGRGDNKVNRIESSNAGMNALNTGEQYLINFDARWVVGSRTLLTHGYRHAMAKSHLLDVPENLGTPGTRNSVSDRLIADTGAWNQGPVLSGIDQEPAVPAPGENVIVSVRVEDIDGIGQVDLRYSFGDPSATPTTIAMTPRGDGRYDATIPGQGQGTKVLFHVTATDGGGRVGRYPVDISLVTHPLVLDPASPGLAEERFFIYRHDTPNPSTNFHNYRFYMSDSEEARLTSRRRLSNDLVHGSFVFGSGDIYHQAKTRFSGSPWARGSWNGSFRVVMPRGKTLFDRYRKFNLEDHHGNGGDMRERTSHYLLRHVQGSSVVPYSDHQAMIRWQVNDRLTATREHVWVPDTQFLSIWYPDDDDGEFLEMDDRFVIDDNGNRTGNTNGRVLYPPPSSRGDGDGSNKENYRWFFGLRANNGDDDFSLFQDFCKLMDPAVTGDVEFDARLWEEVDVEQMLRIWAVRMNTSDWDTWGTNRGKNCYLYRSSSWQSLTVLFLSLY
ncbi:MAG: lamin tail domain-containing protein [Planctomycetota bacterium]